MYLSSFQLFWLIYEIFSDILGKNFINIHYTIVNTIHIWVRACRDGVPVEKHCFRQTEGVVWPFKLTQSKVLVKFWFSTWLLTAPVITVQNSLCFDFFLQSSFRILFLFSSVTCKWMNRNVTYIFLWHKKESLYVLLCKNKFASIHCFPFFLQ